MSEIDLSFERFQFASRGVRGFLAWWGAGLAGWLPLRWQHLLVASADRLLLQVEGDDIRLQRQVAGNVQDLAILPVPALRGTQDDPLADVLTGNAIELPRWLLLPATSGLRRTLQLPGAARDRLREVLGFEIERQTPFAASDVLYDGRVLQVRDDGQLQVELVVVPRSHFDAANDVLVGLSSWLAGVDLADADGRPLGINLLPLAQRRVRANPWRWWNALFLLVFLVGSSIALGQVLANRSEAAQTLQAAVDARATQARLVGQQRQRLVDAVEGGAYLQQQRNARPSVVELIDELARRLPDGTYLEKVSIEGGQLTLVGLSNQAAALVGKLEGARQWHAPALSGALQPDQRTRTDRFTLVAQINDASAPEGSSRGTP
ncbi:MAG: PilN domain-containing protein [Thermomonas sp.]